MNKINKQNKQVNKTRTNTSEVSTPNVNQVRSNSKKKHLPAIIKIINNNCKLVYIYIYIINNNTSIIIITTTTTITIITKDIDQAINNHNTCPIPLKLQ
jgi:hypothetical protein